MTKPTNKFVRRIHRMYVDWINRTDKTNCRLSDYPLITFRTVPGYDTFTIVAVFDDHNGNQSDVIAIWDTHGVASIVSVFDSSVRVIFTRADIG